MTYDIIIIGGGPGGYVAAIRAAQLGFKTCVFESSHLGGICLNWGCIPTKALLRSSEIHHLLHHLPDYGFKIKGLEVDFEHIINRSRAVAKQLSGGIQHLLKKNKIDVIQEKAVLGKKNGTVIAKDKTYTAKHIIIATGARARNLADMPSDSEYIWTYKEAMLPKAMPKTLLVVGSGAIGVEFASFYQQMGADVTLVEVAERILPIEDHEVSILAEKQFQKLGMTIYKQAHLKSLEIVKKQGVKANIEIAGKTESKTFEKVIMAVGITGNIEDIGLEALHIKTEKGHILTNEWCATNIEGYYAIGDVAGSPWLAHKASHEGVLCVEKIAGLKHLKPLDKTMIPGCTYSYPQIASVGFTEQALKEQNIPYKLGKFPALANGKALALGEKEGFIKTLFHAKTGELLGAHMIGAEVTEMISTFVVAKTLETTEAELMHSIFPHPTLSEMLHESVLDAYKQAIHI